MVRRFAVGPDEQVVGLGVGFVAVDVDGVVEQIVLVSRLRAVIRERPVDEIVYVADKSDVVIDGAVMVGRSQQRTILPVDSARVPLHAVMDLRAVGEAADLVSQLVVDGHVATSLPSGLTGLYGGTDIWSTKSRFGGASVSQALGMLASALAGRPVAVAELQAG